MLERSRRRLQGGARDERGAVFVFVAVMMVAILGMAALVVDVGSWYSARRQAQSAADAAALAAVDDLPSSQSTATTDAQTYVAKNISGATASISFPSSSQIKVTVSTTLPSVFGGLLGVKSVNVSASATASKAAASATAGAAIFAMDSNCSDEALVIDNAQHFKVNGTSHSNGSLFADGQNNDIGATTYGGPNKCQWVANAGGPVASGNTYGGSVSPTLDTNSEPWPIDYSASPPTCTAGLTYSGNLDINASNSTITSGVYCVKGVLSINGSGDTCSCTFVAGQFNLNGQNEHFTPYAGTNNLAFYNTGSSTLDINGSSYMNGGSIFSPTAPIVLNGTSNSTISGLLEGYTVTINGSNITMTGTGGSSGSASTTSELIQ